MAVRAGAAVIGTPLEIDNGSGSVRQTGEIGCSRIRSKTRPVFGSFSLILDGRLGIAAWPEALTNGITVDYQEN